MKVIQWGVGYTGTFSLRNILDNPRLDLVGVKCWTNDKDGVDAGELVSRPAAGVKATRDIDSLLALDADCVIYMPRDALADPSVPGSPSEVWVDELLPILEAGFNVVSPLVSATHWRHLANGEAFRDKLNAACQRGTSTVLFSGFDPGFTTDALPYTIASVVSGVTQIRTWEILDYSYLDTLETVQAFGFGARPEQMSATAIDMVKPAWGGACHLLADAFGVEIEDVTVEADIFLSPETFTAQNGYHIEEGTIGALRFAVNGIVDGNPLFSINHVTRMRSDMAPDWPSVGTDGGYRIEIDAYPPFRADCPMGLPGGTGNSFADAVAMTAARCMNSIDAVVKAKPGYKTFLDLSPLGGTYALAPRAGG